MWAFRVVVDAPAFSQRPHRFQRIEDFAVQERVAHFCVEAFAVAVLPRRAGLNVEGSSTSLRQPFTQILGDEFRAIVGTNVLWDAMLDHGFGQHFDNLAAVNPAPNMDRQALARALVDQVQQAHRPSVMGESAHEIVCPDVVAVLWPQAHAGAVVEPKPPAWLLFAAPSDPRGARFALRDPGPLASPLA